MIQLKEGKALEASLQKKIVKEKQRYSDLLEKYEELQSSLSLGDKVQTELTKLQLTMENVTISLEKVETIKKYWSDKVQLVIIITSSYVLHGSQPLYESPYCMYHYFCSRLQKLKSYQVKEVKY